MRLTLEQFREIYPAGRKLRTPKGQQRRIYDKGNYHISDSGSVWCGSTILYSKDRDKFSEIEIVKGIYHDPRIHFPDYFQDVDSYDLVEDDKSVISLSNTDLAISSEPFVPEKKIRVFETGAVRSDDTGRPRPDWISPYALTAIGKHLMGASNDFGACNYYLGIPEKDVLPSLSRHLTEIQEAIQITGDEEALHEAACAMAFNSIALIHTLELKRKGLYKKVYNETQYVPLEEAKKLSTFTK